MQLTSFSVSNYRSITAAHSILLSNITVLIGKNNEGKSNLLRALDAAMSLLRKHSIRASGARRYYAPYDFDYKWKRDFPVQLQQRRGVKNTTFRLEFALSEEEITAFRTEISVNLNGSLPLEIMIGPEEIPEFRVVKTGRGTKTLIARSSQVAKFIAHHIDFNYIPAVRTDRETLNLIQDMLGSELRSLEDNEAYQKALQIISDIQRPLLDSIASRVEAPLKEFLPSIKSVRIEITDDVRRFVMRRGVDVIIDDGTPTSLEHKGDGVKSLAALGLLKSKQSRPTIGASILAIEEPESHLQPGAIHQINEIIRGLSDRHQIILTTHNPLFADRESVTANIIVSEGSAKPAKNIKAVRDILGIRASDNLMHANFALIVEGQEDVIALRALLPTLSKKIGNALKNHIFVIEQFGGAGNLSYKISQLKNALCTTHIFLDHDEAGKQSFNRAVADGLASISNTTFTICSGFTESEFEDTIDPSIYKPRIQTDFGVSLDHPTFSGSKKWSSRIKATFEAQGKPCSNATLTKVKYIVAEEIQKSPQDALHPDHHRSSSILALKDSLELMIKS